MISGVVLGVFLIVQYFTPKVVVSNSPIQEIEAKETLIKELLEEQSYLLTRTKELRKKIEEKQVEIAEQTEEYNLKFLEDLKKASGLKSINGQGIEITFADNSRAIKDGQILDENGLVFASDLRDIVNAILSGNADAVSINNQRIVSGSVISSVGNTILINNTHSASPFIIKAVGNPEGMISSMQNNKLLSDFYTRIDKNNLKFLIQINDELFIQAYNGPLKDDYINLVE